MLKLTFQDRGNRDREFNRLKSQGYGVRKRSMRGQVVSPDYVTDYTGEPCPNGFGGSSPEYFAVLYMIEGR